MERSTDEVAFLVAQAGPLSGQRWALRKNLLVGRETSCDLVIADRQVSRHHACFIVSPEGIFIEDLDSKNGTYVNGQLIDGKTMLQDGDIVQTALVQKFVFLSSDATLPLEQVEAEIRNDSAFFEQAVGGAAAGRLRLDKRSRRVWVSVQQGDQSYTEIEVVPPLSVSQFRLLELLYEKPGRVVSRRDLVTAIWEEKQAYDVSEQALDALVRRLRDRITSIDKTHEYIITVRGHGLRLDNPSL
ncbi:MAG: FHA domain-containing protein [Anaerolineales bacterium]|nr:FHA domain-containing protein [Anaerolineales bacterium]